MKRRRLLATLLFLVGIHSSETALSNLGVDSVGYYDALQSSSAPRERVQNVDVFGTGFSVDASSSASGALLLCHLAVLLPASIYQTVVGEDGSTERVTNRPDRGVFRYYTAAELAAHHFNNGVGDVVPELAGINSSCPVRISSEFFDTEAKSSVATMHLIDATLGRGKREGEALPRSEPARPLPCAVVGSYASPRSDDANHALATVSTLSGLLHLVLDSSVDFDDNDVFPFVGRVEPSALGFARAVVAYLRHLGVGYVGLLYDKNVFGNSFDKAFQDEAVKHDIVVVSVPIVSELKYTDERGNSTTELQSAITRLKRSRFRYFVGHVFDVGSVMAEASTQGIAGPGFNWIHLTGHVTNTEAGTPRDKGTQGLTLLRLEGQRRAQPNYQRFLDIYREGQVMDHINSKWPTYPNDTSIVHNFTIPYATKELYERWLPDVKTAQIYDSVVAIGLAACRAAAVNNSTSAFDGKAHFDALVASKFEGLTGFVRLQEGGSRDPDTAFYAIFNVVRDENKMRKYNSTKSSFYQVRRTFFMEYDRNREEVVWQASPDVSHVYADGSNSAPPPLPLVIEDKNYIGTGLRATVLAFCGVIILLSLGFAVWTYWNRDTRLVKKSQPFFLIMISLGTIIMGSTLIPLSIDDNLVGTHGASIACQASPWLFCIGWVVSFSALFAKIWRINKLFHAKQFRRVVVTKYDVLPPFIALLLCNIAILTAWTVQAPQRWNRKIVSTDEFTRTIKSYGQCVSEGNDLVYVILIVVINGIMLLFGNYQAYRARSISTEFSESRYVALAMASIFQVFFVGIPLMVLVVMPSAQLFVRAGLVVVICLAVLLLVFVPKIIHSRSKVSHPSATNGGSGHSTCSDHSDATGMKITHNNWGGACGINGHPDASEIANKYAELLSEKEAWEREREHLVGALESAHANKPETLVKDEAISITSEQGCSEPPISHVVTVQLENTDLNDQHS